MGVLVKWYGWPPPWDGVLACMSAVRILYFYNLLMTCIHTSLIGGELLLREGRGGEGEERGRGAEGREGEGRMA